MTQQIVLDDLRHLTESLRYPLAVLVSSQHIHEIEEISDKLLVLNNGKAEFFGPTTALGDERTVNRFEVAGDVELKDLRVALTGLEYDSMYYTGVAFVLTTSTSVTSEVVLRRFLDRNLSISYFRDISRSAKTLMQHDGSPR